MALDFLRSGLVLCVENYAECVRFYADVIGLEIIGTLDDEHSRLTTLAFDAGYLMIEPCGVASATAKSMDQNPVWLRFNVSDVDTAAAYLGERGVEVKVRREVWGTVGDFLDPDGNVCSLRQESGADDIFKTKG